MGQSKSHLNVEEYLGTLVYVSVDSEAVYLPGDPNWGADNVKSVDLAALRVQAIVALKRVEAELDRRGLLMPVLSLIRPDGSQR